MDQNTIALTSRLARLERVVWFLAFTTVLFASGFVVLSVRCRANAPPPDRIVIRTADGDTAAFLGIDSLPGEGENVQETILRVAHLEVGNTGKSRVRIGPGIEGGIGITMLDYDGRVRGQMIVSDELNEASIQLFDTSGAVTFSTPLKSAVPAN
jgi:hypothetical protein